MTGPELKDIRLNKLHLIQQELADALVLNRRTIMRYERGQCPIPKWLVPTILRLVPAGPGRAKLGPDPDDEQPDQESA